MKLLRTEAAVGQVLCHDITQIIPGVKKDAVFRKGHIITEKDIPVLLSVGKEHVYVWEKEEGMLHENEAAEILFGLCRGKYMHGTDVKEGKIELIADCDGVLKIEREKLAAVNRLGQMMIASRHANFPVERGDTLAGTRVIPLVIEQEKMEAARRAAAGGPIFQILPYTMKKAGLVTTGNEVYKGRIADSFSPVVKEKLAEYGIETAMHEICSDDHEQITAAIRRMAEAGMEMVICTGGMSVDPDDRTPLAISHAAERIVTYGAPVLPGAMFLLAYGAGNLPILGLPGCVMYAKRTIFDLVLPRLAAGEILEEADFTELGEGGLCLSCPVCTFPNCGFGR